MAPGLSLLRAVTRTAAAATRARAAVSPLRGDLGAAPLPGSELVWQPLNNTLQPCTLASCPLAEDSRPAAAAFAPPGAAPLVNRAQLVSVPVAAALRRGADPAAQLAAYALISGSFADDAAMRAVVDPASGASLASGMGAEGAQRERELRAARRRKSRPGLVPCYCVQRRCPSWHA